MVQPVIPPTVSQPTTTSPTLEGGTLRDPFANSPNPLRKFRSYSYHFILFVCKDMDVFNQLSNASIQDNKEIFLHAPEDDTILLGNGRYRPKSIGANSQTGGNDYCVLINTTTDAELLIDSVEMTNYIFQGDAGVKQGGLAPISSTFLCSMRVSEPLGGDLIMILPKIYRDLNIEPIGAIFGIKPFFIGHTDSWSDDGMPPVAGSLAQVEIIDIKAGAFQLTDLVATFNSSGCTYELQYTSFAHGMAQVPLFNKNKLGGMKVESELTIENAVKTLIQKINDQQTVQPSSNDPNESNIVVVNVEFKDEYVSKGKVDKHFKDYKLDNLTNAQRDKTGIQIPTSRAGILSAIHDICMMSTEYTRQAVSKDATIEPSSSTNRNRYIIRINDTTTIINNVMTITYTLVRQEIVVIASPRANKEKAAETEAQRQEREREKQSILDTAVSNNNLLELDYIFSGRNVDIIEYDLKMHFGLQATYMWHAATNPLSQQAITGKSKSADANISGDPNQTGGKGVEVAPGLLPGTARNSGDPAGIAAFKEFMRKFTRFDAAQARVTIHGNPSLLNGMIRSPATTQSGQSALTEIMKNWDIAPALVKINVYLPNKLWKADVSEDTTEVRQAFRDTPVWFDGIFQITEVQSRFGDGKFTQTLEMNPMINEGSLPNITSAGTSIRGATPPSSQFPGAKGGDTRTSSDAETSYSTNLRGSKSGKRGIRNNNPGNIRRTAIQWKGMAADQSADASFIVFTNVTFGIRAIAKILLSYQRQGYNTIAKIINRYSPSFENPTQALIHRASTGMSINPDTIIDLTTDRNTMYSLVNAIILQENGENPYSTDTVKAGVDLAYS